MLYLVFNVPDNNLNLGGAKRKTAIPVLPAEFVLAETVIVDPFGVLFLTYLLTKR
jgi:hypothetical protein